MRNNPFFHVIAGVVFVCSLAYSSFSFSDDEWFERAMLSAINQYQSSAHLVDLGDEKQKVLAIFQPIQDQLHMAVDGQSGVVRGPDRRLEGDDKVEVYYFRSSWVSDNHATDDEFTPYVFINEKLSSIGWAALGGPKTTVQSVAQQQPQVIIAPQQRNNTLRESMQRSMDRNNEMYRELLKPRSTGRTNCRVIGDSIFCDHY